MKNFEQQIINELLDTSELKDITLSKSTENETLKFSGAGYFLTIKDLVSPKNRVVLSNPDIRGKLGGVDVGYLAFVENSELTLECYSYDTEITAQHRELEFVRNNT